MSDSGDHPGRAMGAAEPSGGVTESDRRERRAELANVLAHTVRTRGRVFDPASALTSIVNAASLAVPGFSHVGIWLAHSAGPIESAAASDQLAQQLDSWQVEIGDGPCLAALAQEANIDVHHARYDVRWPEFLTRAADAGLRSQLALQLQTDKGTLGVLNLYSTTSDTIDPEAARIADAFAEQASMALGMARQIDNLNTAMSSRQTIGQAVGILMARYGLDEHAAFAFLARTSQESNVKLREIAARLIEETTKQ